MGVLVAIHPRVLNPVLKWLAQAKIKQTEIKPTDSEAETNIPELKRYPIWPLLGEIGFVVFRGVGFLLCFLALDSLGLGDIWRILGAFSLAWLLGLVVPGAPSCLGVFEATVLTVLTPTFPAAIVLGAVALYRLNSTLAELLGAGVAVLDERWNLAIAATASDSAEVTHATLPQLPPGKG